MIYVGPEPYRKRMCARLAVGIVEPDALADVLGGIPWDEPLKPIPEEMRDLEYESTPVPGTTDGTCTVKYHLSPQSRFATMVCAIADWFEYRVLDTPGAGAAELVDALRRFAAKLLDPNPDYPALAADLDTLGWMTNRAYDVYEDRYEGG